MKRYSMLPLALLMVAAVLSGCGKNSVVGQEPGSGEQAEQALVTAELAQRPDLMDDGITEDESEISLSEGGSGTAAILPRAFHRVIRDRDRTFSFAFSDSDSTGRPTRAVVIVATRLRGSLVIRAGIPGSDGSGLDSATRVIRKPIDETRVRRVLLRRARMVEGDVIRWRVVATSAVEVKSRNHVTDIVSLRVQNGDRDTTITHPLGFIRLRNILAITPGTDVTLTATTASADDAVFLHAGGRRFRFHANGDGTFTGTWRAGLFARGLHHFGVDAIAHATLFDDEAPYDSNRWAMPFVLVPELLAEPLLPEAVLNEPVL